MDFEERVAQAQTHIPSIQRRGFPLRDVKIEKRAAGEAEGDGEGGDLLVGHAAVFDTWSPEYWGFKECIRTGAFTKTLKDKADVRGLFNHDENLILGRTKSGTLRLHQDDIGLAFEDDLPDTSYAADLAVSMERGDIDQCSFAFQVPTGKETWSTDEDGLLRREILEVKLFDISVVTFPYYPETDAALRELRAAAKLTRLPIEPALRAIYLRGRGMTISPDEKRAAEAVYEQLLEVLALAEPGRSSHSVRGEPDDAHSLDLGRLRLILEGVRPI
jgi:HK97 family phage prohead protease